MTVETTALARRSSFFTRIAETFAPEAPVAVIAITHLLTERPAFIDAIAGLGELAALLPKPKSLDQATLGEIATRYQVDQLTREQFADPETALAYMEKRAAGRPVVLLDVGGYFAPVLGHLCEHFSGQIVGVVEDTENGHQRYLTFKEPPCPVYSVARSPLKQPEDYLVGQSCAFSAEALMRAVGDLPIGRPVAVIGYGKLGRATAATLHVKGSVVRIFDTDPVRAAQALAAGYVVAASGAEAIAGAGLVLCATGNHALGFDDFAKLANGAHIATVTSSEDELDLSGLTDFYSEVAVAEHVTRYETIGHYFYLHNGGNAVNFIHGAVVGPFIHLVQAEILAAAARLADGTVPAGHHEMTTADRQQIAAIWLDYYRSNA
ncbi:adenosylhomocysteinase [Glycomyces halotolerans]